MFLNGMNLSSDTPFFRDGGCLTADTRVFAASTNQVRYVLAELSKMGSYMISVGHMVVGPFDERAFHHAAQALVARHEALRTRFHFDEGHVSAIVSPGATPRIHQCQMSDERFSAFRTWALPLIFDDVNPLADGSLIRFLVADYGARWRFTIAAHHAITDGFSRGTMNTELLKLYAGETLTEAQSYYTFAQGHPARAECSDAVRRLVDDLPKPAQLARDGVADTEDAAGRFVKHSFAGQARQIRTVSKAIGTTKFGFLAAVYAIALSRFSMGDDVSTFFQTEGRKVLGAPNSVIGPFTNTLPLNARFDPNQGFADVARTLAETTKRTIALEGEPVLGATIAAGKAPGVSINMFPPAGRITAGDLEIGPREFLDRRTEYDLNLVWSDDQGEVNARAFYNASNLSEDRVTLFVAFLARILDAALANPDRTCREILSATSLPRSCRASSMNRSSVAEPPAS